VLEQHESDETILGRKPSKSDGRIVKESGFATLRLEDGGAGKPNIGIGSRKVVSMILSHIL